MGFPCSVAPSPATALPHLSSGMERGGEAQPPQGANLSHCHQGWMWSGLERLQTSSGAGSRRDVLAGTRLTSLWDTTGDLERKGRSERAHCRPAPSLMRDRSNLQLAKSSQMKEAPALGSCYPFTDASHIPSIIIFLRSLLALDKWCLGGCGHQGV